MKSNFLFLCSFLLLISCFKKKETSEKQDYHKGVLEVYTDASFGSVLEALADAYEIRYPDTDIQIKEMKEDFGFINLLEDKTKLIVMSRELNEKQIAGYEEMVGLKYQPARFAVDAVVFVVAKDSPIQQISVEEVEKGLLTGSQKFVFDGANSGNIGFVAQKFGKKSSELKYTILNGNENVIKGIAKIPNAIGVVSLNTISRVHNKESQALRDMVRILPVADKGMAYTPTIDNLRTLKYPFHRTLYFLVNEGGFHLAGGFVRFSATHIGQKVVEKEGLQPYNIYKREVKISE